MAQNVSNQKKPKTGYFPGSKQNYKIRDFFVSLELSAKQVYPSNPGNKQAPSFIKSQQASVVRQVPDLNIRLRGLLNCISYRSTKRKTTASFPDQYQQINYRKRCQNSPLLHEAHTGLDRYHIRYHILFVISLAPTAWQIDTPATHVPLPGRIARRTKWGSCLSTMGK